MAVKKTARKAARKTVKPPRAKAPAKEGLECRVCGYRLIVDKTCGCAEEHVLICCGQPMMRTSDRTATA